MTIGSRRNSEFRARTGEEAVHIIVFREHRVYARLERGKFQFSILIGGKQE